MAMRKRFCDLCGGRSAQVARVLQVVSLRPGQMGLSEVACKNVLRCSRAHSILLFPFVHRMPGIGPYPVKVGVRPFAAAPSFGVDVAT